MRKTVGPAGRTVPIQRPDADADTMALDDANKMFEAAPISLWLEDYGALKQLFQRWRAAGIADLGAFLREDPARIRTCSQSLRVLKVNAATLRLFEASSADHLIGNLDTVFRGDMLNTFVEELVQLWNGAQQFQGTTVNYSLTGRRIDIQLKGTILKGHEEQWDRVLVAVEDVTERETALRRLALSDSYARGLFEHSPVSLWVEDFSGVKTMLDDLRFRGIEDFRTFTDVHPEFVLRCMSEIRVIDINRHTLELFGAADKPELLRRLADVFRDDMQRHFREQLVDLWDRKLFQRREVVNYALDGTELHLHMQFSVLPGHEKRWDLVQVALTDITARKKAEAYLEFLGKHDVLTKLCNRSFYNDELNQLERKSISPVTIIMADLNGLKAANDHARPCGGRQPASARRGDPHQGRRRAAYRGADRRRRIRHRHAARHRARRRGRDQKPPRDHRAQQPVPHRIAAVAFGRHGDERAGRAPRGRRLPRRPRHVRRQASLPSDPQQRAARHALKGGGCGASGSSRTHRRIGLLSGRTCSSSPSPATHTGSTMATRVHTGDLPDGVQFANGVAIDTETLGLNPHRDRLCVVQLSGGDGTADVVQIAAGQRSAPNLQRLLADPAVPKLFHFGRFDIAVMFNAFGTMATNIYCTKIASKLVRTYTDRHGLRDLCRELLGIDLSKQQQSSDWGAAGADRRAGRLCGLGRAAPARAAGAARRPARARRPAELAQACFAFLPTRARLDLRGWPETDIFAHE